MVDLLAELRRGVEPDRRLFVAVSGGADSVALLVAAHQLGLNPTAVHLNHGLRGDESEADEGFVRELADRLGIECVAERIEVSGGNLEAAARAERYTALARIAAGGQALTGHTADDQAETVLHRLIRGSGLGGLAGIQPRLRLGDAIVGRPWLRVRRQALREFLSERGVGWREDSSNRDPRFTRNRVRAELLPLLSTFNPRIVEQLGRLAEQARDYRRHERRRVRADLDRVELPRAGVLCVFHVGRLATLSRDRLRSLWPYLWRREGWPAVALGFRDWDRLAGLCVGESSAVDVAGGVRARRVERVIRVGPGA